MFLATLTVRIVYDFSLSDRLHSEVFFFFIAIGYSSHFPSFLIHYFGVAAVPYKFQNYEYG